jgi:hypothetical protein
VDLSCLAKGRASVPGAACKARQRTGKAGSAATAWLAPRALAAVLGLVVLSASWLPAHAADNGNLGPRIEKARQGERCVEDTATMRRNHMRFLEHQRDATVHGGIRGAKHSLKGCIECHAGAQSGSVARTAGDFCASCHIYAAVKVDCFECHSSRPQQAAKKNTP